MQSNKNDLIITEEAMRGIKLARKMSQDTIPAYEYMIWSSNSLKLEVETN